jgi:GrpB-like predicted nucleotidyltransferase (UPF0157 family)
VGIDPDGFTDPSGAWLLLFARYGTRVTISDRYALEAAVRGISTGELPTDVKAQLGREVLESQFPGIELIGEPSGNPVEVVAYDPQWPEVFASWRDRLQRVVPAATLIVHVGSTAVPGLAAKPVVDIQTSVPDIEDEAAYVPGIESLGVPLRSRDPKHRYFRPPADRPRLVHIHVCAAGGEWEMDHLLFRDYLRTHDAVRDSYGELKTRLALQHREDRLAYTDAKASFILDTMEQARAWATQTGWTLPNSG